MLLGCNVEDQKNVRRRLLGLLDHIKEWLTSLLIRIQILPPYLGFGNSIESQKPSLFS
jgi:hypothetical protein